jgi:hypothetical protein
MWTPRWAVHFRLPARPQLGWWAVVVLCLVASTGFYTDILRLVNPIGEKYVPPFPPGQNDFSYSYDGARALIARQNPYHNDRPELTNPIFRVAVVDGVPFKQLYPPGHLLTLVPLALWKGTNWQEAARLWFRFNLLALLALAVLTWALVRRATNLPLTPLWIVLLFAALALNPGTELGLERGQSDILIALLCWAAVFSFLQGAIGSAIFLAIWGTSIKGYPLLLASGLIVLALARGRWKPTLVGVGAAVIVLVLPVWRYFATAAKGAKARADMFWPVWYNHGFRNLVFRWFPLWADRGRTVLSAFALAVAAGAWIQAWRAASRGSRAASAFWLVLFATASLGTMLGYSALSVSYNLILILPGTLVLAACQDHVSAAFLSMRKWTTHALGAALLACLFLLFICRLGDDPPGYDGNIPAAAYGIAMLFPILGALVARGLSRRVEG